jgi:hypothetical protein
MMWGAVDRELIVEQSHLKHLNGRTLKSICLQTRSGLRIGPFHITCCALLPMVYAYMYVFLISLSLYISEVGGSEFAFRQAPP